MYFITVISTDTMQGFLPKQAITCEEGNYDPTKTEYCREMKCIRQVSENTTHYFERLFFSIKPLVLDADKCGETKYKTRKSTKQPLTK